MTTHQNYYELFGITQEATKYEIKQAFFKLSKQWHPDVCKKKNATEMFQLINEAYQTLYDDKTRKEYDAFLNNQNNDNFEFENEEYFDVTILDEYIINPFNEKAMDELFNDLDMEDIMHLYEYFWITFWSGSHLSELLLKNKSLQSFFLYFMGYDYLREEVLDELMDEARQCDKEQYTVFKNIRKAFVDSVNQLNNDLEQTEFSEDTKLDLYNFMTDVINEDNCFDSELSAYFATEYIDEVKNIFCWFESIYYQCRDLQNVGSRTVINNKFSHKKASAWGWGSVGVVGLIIFIIIAIIVI